MNMEPPTNWKHCTHAIIVCGHAVFKGGPFCHREQALHDSVWELLPYQRGEPKIYAAQIRRGVMEAHKDASALLIFSGGQTRPSQILSEGQSYMQLAEVFSFWGMQESVLPRTTTEEFSRDSYDNCLYGIARFAECTGRLPSKLTIVSWSFKQTRFDFHVRNTLRWTDHDYHFLGVGRPEDIASAENSEKIALAQFEKDCTGNGSVLGAKKKGRNPFRRFHGYAESVPILRDALRYNGLNPLPIEICPWLTTSTQNCAKA